jgi:hypothetical protein
MDPRVKPGHDGWWARGASDATTAYPPNFLNTPSN